MLLYHYCSLEKFKSIIESKSLWLTKIIKSNDTEEVNRTFKIIWGKIQNKIKESICDLENSNEIMTILNKQMEVDLHLSTAGNETPYGVCLSVNRDLAQNWNEYGDISRGIGLGFSNELLMEIPHDMPHPSTHLESAIGWNQVYYDRDDLSEKFASLFIDILRRDISASGWLTVRATLKHYSAFIKNPTFQDEREVRIIYYPRKEHTKYSHLEITTSIESDLPHCALPWVKSNGICALKEIIIGTNCKYTEKEIKTLLQTSGVSGDITIVNSEYPYRISENR